MSDEWEVFPLRALVDRVVQKNDDGLDLVFSVSAQDGLVDQETYFKKRVASKNLSSYWVVEPGDYVFNKSYSEGFPLGAVVRHTGESPGVVSPLYIVMRPKADSPLVHGWLDFAFESREYAQSLRGLMKEGGRAHGALNVKLDDYFSALIPVPPLPVQRRIVDLMAHLDNHLANLQTERDAVRQLWESLVCEPPFTQGDVALGDALERIEAGKSPAGEDRVPGANERGVLKVSAVGQNSFHPDEVKTVSSSTVLPDYSKVSLGDVLMVRANGVLDRVGQVCQVPVQVSNLYLCDKTLRLVPKPSLDGTFLTGALLSPKAREQIVALTGGSHMRNISQSAIRQIRIPLPPHDEQSRIGHLFQSISNRESSIEQELEACLSYRVALLGSLLRARVSIPESYDSLLSEVA